MLESFASLLICLEDHQNIDCSLIESTCKWVRILCHPLSNPETHRHILVPFGVDQSLATLSSLASL